MNLENEQVYREAVENCRPGKLLARAIHQKAVEASALREEELRRHEASDKAQWARAVWEFNNRGKYLRVFAGKAKGKVNA